MLTKQFQSFSKLSPDDPAIWGRMRWGHFRWGGGGTTRDGKDVFDYAKEFRPQMFPDFDRLSDSTKRNALDDVMHLSIHFVYGRDIFLTRNVKHFKTETLVKTYPDIVVLDPQELVDILDRSTDLAESLRKTAGKAPAAPRTGKVPVREPTKGSHKK